MKRLLSNLLLAACVAVLLAAIAIDVMSRWTLYIFSRGFGITLERIELVDGQVIVSTADDPDKQFRADFKTPTWTLHRTDLRGTLHGPLFPGFHYLDQHPYPRIQNYRELGVPFWPIMLASAVIPGIRLRAWMRRRRRARKGMCLTCGYDLRESPERCPECGAAARFWT